MNRIGQRVRGSRGTILSIATAVLLVAGVTAVVIGVRAQRQAPQPPLAAASPVDVIPSTPGTDRSSPRTGGAPTPSATTRGQLLSRSLPTHLTVPAIGVDTALSQIGPDSSGRIKTPPLDRDSRAYWLSVSPTPGQLGPSTIIGHVDSAAYGPAVFFRLGALRQRDTISVTRGDGTVAVFQVERVVEYSKAKFPTQAVYGNIDHAGLRLITCGGTFNASKRSYDGNIVVYAALVSTRHA